MLQFAVLVQVKQTICSTSLWIFDCNGCYCNWAKRSYLWRVIAAKASIISFSQLEEVHFTEISALTAAWAGALYFVGWIPFILGFMLVWGG